MSSFMKTSLRFIAIFLVCLLGSGCAGPHEFGPYKGKIIDKETDKPIEGAVVFIQFFTEGGQFIGLAGGRTVYASSTECLTDSDGEFYIPKHKISTFRFLHRWKNEERTIIFKPGFGAFPRHPDTSIKGNSSYSIPENKYVTIVLPKLKTREERIRNLGYATFTGNIPRTKWEKLFELRNIEAVSIGQKPWPK